MARNKISDLRDHLFASLERIDDDSLTPEQTKAEVDKAKAVAQIGSVIINSAKVEIDFIKKNGEARTITCTLDEGKMLGYVHKSDNVRAKSKESLSVYDLEKNGWRAFRYDSVTCIKFNI